MKFTNFYKINLQCPRECKKCATKNNAINGQENSKKTCLQRYGVQYSFQSQNNKLKTIQTRIKKYGPNWKQVSKKILYDKLYGPDKRDQNGKLLNHNRK